MPSCVAKRVPNSPHVAVPRACTAWRRRTVVCAHGSTKAGTRSVKILREQSALSQKNLRICNLSCTRKPAQGRSATTRVYRLWRRLARQKQSGQYTFTFVETTCTTSRSSLVSMVAISNPAGRGSKGDEDMISKTPNLGIALVCDQTLQYITLHQASPLHQSRWREAIKFVKSLGNLSRHRRHDLSPCAAHA